MKPQRRKPARRIRAEDVALLQERLLRLGYRISENELKKRRFGKTTGEALVQFQKKSGAKPTGLADAETASLIEQAAADVHGREETESRGEDQGEFVVRGQVRGRDGAPVSRAVVNAFDKDLRSEQPLGKPATTDALGRYEIPYSAAEFRRTEKRRADLIVRAFDAAGNSLASSDIIFNSVPDETVDLHVAGSAGPSEYDTLVREVAPLLGGVRLDELTHEDVAFLAGETEFDAQLITWFAESARCHIEADSIPQSAFYGLFRQNFSTLLKDLFEQDMAALRAALQRSSEEGIVPRLTADELDAIVERLQAVKAGRLLRPADPQSPASLGDVLATAQLSAEKQRIVGELKVQHEAALGDLRPSADVAAARGGLSGDFWKALEERDDFSKQDVEEVRLTLALAELSENHPPLMRELRRAARPAKAVSAVQQHFAPEPTLDTAAVLRSVAGLDAAGWKALLLRAQPNGDPIGAPPTTPGADPAERLENYATELSRRSESAMPAMAIAGRIESDNADDNPFRAGKGDFRTFFDNNPSLDFRTTTVAAYLSEDREEKLRNIPDPERFAAELGALQRLANITPRYSEIRTLYADDLHSAQAVVLFGERRFADTYAGTLGSRERAVEIYRKAEHTHATAFNLYMRHARAFNMPLPYVISGAPATAADAVTGVPDLAYLFGSLDLCACRHCQSLYSPAAYFVDILRFLRDAPATEAGLNPLQVLFSRRPDLENIALTCENTNTPLPYVDLVNEVLEARVAPRVFEISEPANVNMVLGEMNAGKVPSAVRTALAANGYALSPNASVRKDGEYSAIDKAWVFQFRHQGLNEGFRIWAWPQTSWTEEELRANPEHLHDPAYDALRNAVYPWNLPLNLPVEEARAYLAHMGLQRHELMEVFFRGAPSTMLSDTAIAEERLGLTAEEADIITGGPSGQGAWTFWGLQQGGNDLVDTTDGTAPRAQGDWDVVLQRVSLFLQRSGLSYKQLLELLDSYFINPATAAGERRLGIVSTDPADAATCRLSKLSIQVVDSAIAAANRKSELIAAWNKMHRFVRLWRKLGWKVRDVDQAISALATDITPTFLLQLSHIGRLCEELHLEVLDILAWWALIDTRHYIDYATDEQRVAPSLYARLFNNKSAAGEVLAEDPAALSGSLLEAGVPVSAALEISVADFGLLYADRNVIPAAPGSEGRLQDDTLSLENLSRLYRHATLAKALKLSIRSYLSALALVDSAPFTSTAATVDFVQRVNRLRASGFTVDDVDYLLCHTLPSRSDAAPTDGAIVSFLDSVRDDVRKLFADNTFVEASTDPAAATTDPEGALTRKKLALLNLEAPLIERIIATLNDSFTHEAALATLAPGIVIPEVLRNRLSYDSTAGKLRFTGTMSAAVLAQLVNLPGANNEFIAAVQGLENAPKAFVARHLRRFSVPVLDVGLNALPANLKFPDALKEKIYYDDIGKKLVFTGVMTDAERESLLRLSTDASYQSAVQSLFNAPTAAIPKADEFLTTAPDPSNDVGALFNATATPNSRFLIVLSKLLPYLRSTLSERAVKQRLVEFLRLDSNAVDALFRMRPVPTDRVVPGLLSFAEINPNVKSSSETLPSQFSAVLWLHKISVLVHKFGMTTRQLGWVIEFGPSANWLDLNALASPPTSAHARFTSWERLADLFRLRDALSDAEQLLTEIFTAARESTAQLEDLLAKLAGATQWRIEDLEALSGANGFALDVDAFKNEQAMLRLVDAFAALKRLGASAAQCLAWTKSPATEAEQRAAAREIKSLAKAKQDMTQWQENAKALRDPLRERARGALIAYLVAQAGVRDAAELFDDFLIDPEMSPCMMTTRIKQAISSVQLFIQRSLMSLESDVNLTPREAREWREWRKQYRVWEANRKVLFYPENWIEPELRDDKSPFFKELEHELLQDDVTAATAESAFLHFLERLSDVGRLQVVGFYREYEDPSTDRERRIDVVHVIARTFAAPHIYYYRRNIDLRRWTAWEKIEAEVQSDHVIPIVRNRRLYLFWPLFREKQAPQPIKMPAAGDALEEAPKRWEIQIACSEYKNGRWSPKRLSQQFLVHTKHPLVDSGQDAKDFSFKTRVVDPPPFVSNSLPPESLVLECYGTVVYPSAPAPTPQTAETPTELLASVPQNVGAHFVFKIEGQVLRPSEQAQVEVIGKNRSTGITVLSFWLTGTVLKRPPATLVIDYYLRSAAFTKSGEVTSSQHFDTIRTVRITYNVALTARAPVAPPKPQVVKPNPIRMRAIGRFVFDDARGDWHAVPEARAIPQIEPTSLEPLFGTRFENMMMAEDQNPENALGTGKMLRQTPGTFSLLGMHQTYVPKALNLPVFFQDDTRVYFVFLRDTAKILFAIFYHPRVRNFLESLNRHGIPGLLTLANQRLTDSPPKFDEYQPDPSKIDTALAPREDVDFSYDGAYALYNWELFFHAPFLVAMQLSRNQRFEEAQKWFHYIFDPTATDSPERPTEPGPERFWRFKPFYDEAMRGIQTLQELLADAKKLDSQMVEWKANPFKPHVIARLRVVAYMKAVVMRYIDNLIAWGDQLFRRETIEAINEATQLYILAAQILGRRPEDIPARAKPKVQTFRTLDDRTELDALSNALVEIEAFLPPSVAPAPPGGTQGGSALMPYFCMAPNEKLLGYWDTVADRLFKIRHCMNIEGVVRALPIFEPPIDPGLLVKAAAAGVDLASALSDINAPLPHYRFSAMLQKANELCGEVKALGTALLSALEKRDAEALALMRSTHELNVLKAVRAVREKQLEEASEAREALEKTKQLTTLRRDYYRDIAFTNPWEIAQLSMSGASLLLQTGEVATLALAGALHLIPDLKTGAPTSLGITFGGSNAGESAKKFSDSVGKVASLLNSGAAMAATLGGHWRRFEDWKLQERLANKELEQIEKQIAAADIRKAIAQKELDNHDLQTENSQETDNYMRSKFTSQQLYDWMVGQISAIYFQSYQLAYDVAKRTERAYRHELGLRDSAFVRFGYWDSLRKGLLAGERLHQDLKRMDVSYLDLNRREYEITKHISLAAVDPVALMRLKQTGDCFVSLAEALFDLEYPGHFMRRIRSVGITIPCVAGPYASVNCTLSLQASTVRHTNSVSGGSYARVPDDSRFTDGSGAIQSIVTSSGQNDSGLFELDARDERYLPFEGQGAISTWRIQIPQKFKSFDHNSIADVILHLRYTARDGGAQLRTQALNALTTALNTFARSEGQKGLARTFSLRHEFPTEWHRFLNPPPAATQPQTLTLPLGKERFPFSFGDNTLTITAFDIYAKVDPKFAASYTTSAVKLSFAAGTAASNAPLTLSQWHGLLRGTKSPAGAAGNWTLTGWLEKTVNNTTTTVKLDADAIDDILVCSHYTIS